MSGAPQGRRRTISRRTRKSLKEMLQAAGIHQIDIISLGHTGLNKEYQLLRTEKYFEIKCENAFSARVGYLNSTFEGKDYL